MCAIYVEEARAEHRDCCCELYKTTLMDIVKRRS